MKYLKKFETFDEEYHTFEGECPSCGEIYGYDYGVRERDDVYCEKCGEMLHQGGTRFDNTPKAKSKEIAETWDDDYETNWFSKFLKIYPTYEDFKLKLGLNDEEWDEKSMLRMMETQVGPMEEGMSTFPDQFIEELMDYTEWGKD